MKYQNANAILPEQLLSQIQEYVQGKYLYIPAPEETRKGWGENSGARESLCKRNEEICYKYQQGLNVDELAEKYFLSVHSIKKIIYRKNKDSLVIK